MRKEMVCIACPIGCRLTAEWNDDPKDVQITGSQCRRGEEYGTEEVLAPSRVVTATVAVNTVTATATMERRAPVKSTKPVPRELIDGLLDELYKVRLSAPVRIGQAVVKNYRDTNIDIIATRTIGGNT